MARACALASAAFASFGKSDGTTRAALLRRIADLIGENAAALVERAQLETGLPVARLQGEVNRTTGQLRLFALAAGCPVIVKAHHGHPGTSEIRRRRRAANHWRQGRAGRRKRV